jgi:hypothetical protein
MVAAIDEMVTDVRARFLRRIEGLPACPGPCDLFRFLPVGRPSRCEDLPAVPCPILSGDAARMEPRSRGASPRPPIGLAGLIAPLLTELGHADADAAGSRSVVSEAVGAVSLARAIGPSEQSDAILDRLAHRLKRRLGLPAEPVGVVQ